MPLNWRGIALGVPFLKSPEQPHPFTPKFRRDAGYDNIDTLRKRPPIIALHGLPESGKSTIATHLTNRYGYIKFSFGDKLKEVVASIYDLSYDQCFGELKDVVDPRYGVTPRFMLQKFGTEVAREVHPDTWSFPLIKKRKDFPNAHFVIDDLRFENEVRLLRGMGAVLVRVVRLGHIPNGHVSCTCITGTCAECMGTGLLPYHESNRPLNGPFDVHILNSGTVEELYKKVDLLMEAIRLNVWEDATKPATL